MYKVNLKKEEELLRKAQNDNQKYDDIYRYFLNDVYRYSYSMVNNKSDAEDITSETFLAFYKKLNNYKWQNKTMKSWLFITARNIFLKKIHNNFTQSQEIVENSTDQSIHVEGDAIEKHLVNQAKAEILNLSRTEQEIINLKIWEDLSFIEIAEILKEKESTLKMRFYRAIEKLKSKIVDKQRIPDQKLFSIIGTIGLSSNYIAPASLSNLSFSSLLGTSIITNISKTNFMETIQKLLFTKAAAAVLVTTATAVTLVGGYSTYKYFTDPQYKTYSGKRYNFNVQYDSRIIDLGLNKVTETEKEPTEEINLFGQDDLHINLTVGNNALLKPKELNNCSNFESNKDILNQKNEKITLEAFSINASCDLNTLFYAHTFKPTEDSKFSALFLVRNQDIENKSQLVADILKSFTGNLDPINLNTSLTPTQSNQNMKSLGDLGISIAEDSNWHIGETSDFSVDQLSGTKYYGVKLNSIDNSRFIYILQYSNSIDSEINQMVADFAIPTEVSTATPVNIDGRNAYRYDQWTQKSTDFVNVTLTHSVSIYSYSDTFAYLTSSPAINIKDKKFVILYFDNNSIKINVDKQNDFVKDEATKLNDVDQLVQSLRGN